jgi:integrase
VADLRTRDGVAARALELVILCAVRTGDIIGNDRDDKPPMERSHVNFKERVWTIPSTKNDEEHKVPLSAAALAVLRKQIGGEGNADDVVFPGMKDGQPLSNMAMLNLIGRMNGHRTSRGLALYLDPKQGGAVVTPHGFRSTFRDWAAERTKLPTRRRRDGARPRDRERRRERLPTWPPARQAAATDGCVGGILRQGGRGREGY